MEPNFSQSAQNISHSSIRHSLKGKLSPFWNLVNLVANKDLGDPQVIAIIHNEAKNCQSQKEEILRLINRI